MAFSLDVELDRRLKGKEEAKAEAERIRGEIRPGTFVRAADRRRAALTATPTPGAVTLQAFASTYVERVSKVRERNKSWTIEHPLHRNDEEQASRKATVN